MLNEKEMVLDFVRRQGPVLPIQVAKIMNSNTMFAGAILSELIANKLVKISSAKIGGSPVYYVLGQEEKLSILYDHLPAKEKEAYNLLKENIVLIDEQQEPSIRFALSQIKDFSIPFFVNIKNNDLKFWRWHLIQEEQAIKMVNDFFKEPEKIQEQKQEIKIEEQKVLTEKIKKTSKQVKSKFFENIYEFLNKNKVSVIQEEIIRKGKEINLIAKVSSSLGELTYLIKAVDKKNLSEKDVIYAHNNGNMKKMPVILISKGKLSKKAQKYINENLKGYLSFKAME